MRNENNESLRVNLISVKVVVIHSLESLIMSSSCSLYSKTGQLTTALAGNRSLIHYLRPAKQPLSMSAFAPGRTEETQIPEEWFRCW